MKVSVVIPAFNHFDLTGERLMELYQNCTVDEVIVVDDCSTDPKTHSGYEFWSRVTSFPLKVIRLHENVGFLKASNRGLQEATGEIVALISNDVKIKKDFASITRIIFDSFPNILLGDRLLDYDTGWNCFEGKVYPYIEGWALIATRKAWEDFNYFDERFAPHDFEDVDLSTTAISKGYELKTFPAWHGEVLEHMVAQSIPYGEEREAITKAHRKLFEEKWVTKVNP